MPIDFSRSFFEQYRELASRVPRFPLGLLNSENCDYSNAILDSKNCYMIFGSVGSEDCLYGHIVWRSKSCVDCLYAYESEECSHCLDLTNCYSVHYSQEVANCRESYFLYDCKGCSNCFCCYNLRNSQYCWDNQQLSRGEYEKRISSIFPLSRVKKDECYSWLIKMKNYVAIHPANIIIQSENVTGNHLYYSKNLIECFDVKRSEDASHSYTGQSVYNSSDISFSGGDVRWCVDCITLTRCEECFYSHYLGDCNSTYYSEFCFSSSNIFGCIGLKRQNNCILNKQYSSEEYQRLKEKLILQMRKNGEWGEFFPGQNSFFAYNEAIVQDYLPLSKEEALSSGYSWNDELDRPAPKQAIAASNIPTWAPDDYSEILGKSFICPDSGRGFKFITQELNFYKKMKLPLPTSSFYARNLSRMRLRNTRVLKETNCIRCHNAIKTTAAEDVFDRVYCEECYLREVIG